MLDVRRFKSFYKSLDIGDSFYLNTIDIKEDVKNYIQTLVQKKEIAPVKEEVEKIYTQDCHNRIYNGEFIAPGISYKKIN